MKDIKLYLRLMIVAIGLMAVACDDDGEGTTSAVFPQLQKIECAVGDEKALAFDANSDWSLTSSALWCTFLVDGEEVFSCSGSAGKQSVTVKISNDATALMKSYRADLTLIMEGTNQVIFEVTRPMTGYELKAFNSDQTIVYGQENPYSQDYAGNQSFVVSANADWIMEASESIDLSNTKTYGLAGDVVSIKPILKDGFQHRKAPWQQELRFRNKAGEVIATLPVHYDGIPADKVEFSNPNPMGESINFEHDGYSYTWNEAQFDAPMPLSVAARNDQYKLVYVEYTQTRNDMTWEYEFSCTRMTDDESWIFADDDHAGELTVFMTGNQGAARDAFLMVFPNSVYETVAADFDNLVFSTQEGISAQYAQYVAGRFNQKANPKLSGGFAVYDMENNPLYDLDGMAIETISYMDAIGDMSEAEMMERYGTTNVSILSLPLGVPYDGFLVKPNGFTGYYIQSNPVVLWDGVEVAMYSMLETMIIGIGDSTNGGQPMEISFFDEMGEVYAVLLVMRY